MSECSICAMFFSSSLTVSIQSSFSEQNLSAILTVRVLHIVFNFSDKLYTIKERFSNKAWPIYPCPHIVFLFDVLQKLALLQRFTVIHVTRSEHKVQYLLPFIIDYQMQLESEELVLHGTFSTFSDSFKGLMNQDSFGYDIHVRE